MLAQLGNITGIWKNCIKFTAPAAFAVLGAATIIFVIGISIDKLRNWIFKGLEINQLAVKIEEIGRNVVEKRSC